MGKRYFSPKAFEFLRELESNNDRTWWEANKERYIEVIREPALDFINDFGPAIKGVSPHFTADSRTVGGSLMRPYRDIRFSKDKTPFKTNVGIQFRHQRGKDVHAPGFYVHLEPRASFAGAGMWHPEPKVAQRIRQAIYEDPAGWEKATRAEEFSSAWSIDQDEDEYLKRLPKGFEPDHPWADDLRLKSFIASTRLTQAQVTSPGFLDDLADRFGRAGPMTDFLCAAVGLPF